MADQYSGATDTGTAAAIGRIKSSIKARHKKKKGNSGNGKSKMKVMPPQMMPPDPMMK